MSTARTDLAALRRKLAATGAGFSPGATAFSLGAPAIDAESTPAETGVLGLPRSGRGVGFLGVAPGAMTEVLTLLDVRYKPTELGRSASFHVFSGPVLVPRLDGGEP